MLLTTRLCWNLKRKLGGRDKEMTLSGEPLSAPSDPLEDDGVGVFGGGFRRFGRRNTTPPPPPLTIWLFASAGEGSSSAMLPE